MLLLQNLPTHNWNDSYIGVLVAEAYRLKFTYADAPKHFEGKSWYGANCSEYFLNKYSH